MVIDNDGNDRYDDRYEDNVDVGGRFLSGGIFIESMKVC